MTYKAHPYGAWLLLLCCAACSAEATTSKVASPDGPMLLRWSVSCAPAGPPPLPFRVEISATGPLQATALLGAVRDVLLPLRHGAVPLFREAREDEAAIEIGWRSRAHAGCADFLESEGDLAHAGPAQLPGFIHLNPAFAWEQAGGPDVRSAILHEALHFYGLGHAADPEAVMCAGFGMEQRRTLRTADMQALDAILGGPQSSRPALLLLNPEDQQLMQQIPLSEDHRTVRHAVLDVDSDGREELLLYATQGSLGGDLIILRFQEDGRLQSSTGPFPGALDARLDNEFTRTAEGHPLLLAHRADGRFTATRFNATGLPTRTLSHGTPLSLQDGRRDANGDGRFDDTPAPTPNLPASKLQLGPRTFALERRSG